MNWFRRLCLFLFSLCGLLSLAALSLTWVGPWTEQARTLLLEKQWYLIILEVCVCISGCGFIVCLFRALFTPRNPRETIVAEVEGGNITVTRTAIISQTRHLIESDGRFVASSVRVRVRKRGHVRVSARVTPRRPVDVVKSGEELYARLDEGLAHVCGQSVQSIAIVFTDPEQIDVTSVEPSQRVTGHREERAHHVNENRGANVVSLPAERLSQVRADSQEGTDDTPSTEEITVPVGPSEEGAALAGSDVAVAEEA